MSEMPQLVPTYRALLSDRQRREADFYNRKSQAVSAAAPDADLMLRLDRYPVPGPHLAFGFERALKAMGGLAGLRVLDLGCGDGRTAVWFALRGAIVVGVDVSEGSLAVARRRAALHKVTATTKFLQVPAEDLAAAFGAGSFDSVFGYAVIHLSVASVMSASVANKTPHSLN